MMLHKAEALQYWNYAISGNDGDMFWVDMNFGTYILVHFSIYTVIAISVMTVFYLISRLSVNYIVGVAIGISTTVVVGVLLPMFTESFLDVQRSRLISSIRSVVYHGL